MNENQLSGIIISCCLRIHRDLGPGLFESVYEEILAYELAQLDLGYKRQVTVPVNYGKVKLDIGFRVDIIVEDKVILELKAVETLLPVHKKQLLTYLKLTGMKLGLLLNFNEELMKNGIVRIVNNL
jgi:GxxExxY protein